MGLLILQPLFTVQADIHFIAPLVIYKILTQCLCMSVCLEEMRQEALQHNPEYLKRKENIHELRFSSKQFAASYLNLHTKDFAVGTKKTVPASHWCCCQWVDFENKHVLNKMSDLLQTYVACVFLLLRFTSCYCTTLLCGSCSV